MSGEHNDPIGHVIELMAILGITINDLSDAMSNAPSTTSGPSVVTVLTAIRASSRYSPSTLSTYQSCWRIVEELFGDADFRSFDSAMCEQVVETAYRRARSRFPDRACRSTKETAITALRALLQYGERHGLITTNPALALDKPRRTTSLRRGLTPTELAAVWDAVALTTRDPGLDLLLIRFHLWSGARRAGALGLRVKDINHARASVWLHEKFDETREQPIPPSLIRELSEHAENRGASEPSDMVFRTLRSKPIHRRHYNALFDKVQAHLSWERVPVTAHVLRHCAIAAVEREAGYAVAVAFAGHRADRSGITGTYAKASVEEVAAAVSRLSGEDHPLAAER